MQQRSDLGKCVYLLQRRNETENLWSMEEFAEQEGMSRMEAQEAIEYARKWQESMTFPQAVDELIQATLDLMAYKRKVFVIADDGIEMAEGAKGWSKRLPNVLQEEAARLYEKGAAIFHAAASHCLRPYRRVCSC